MKKNVINKIYLCREQNEIYIIYLDFCAFVAVSVVYKIITLRFNVRNQGNVSAVYKSNHIGIEFFFGTRVDTIIAMCKARTWF